MAAPSGGGAAPRPLRRPPLHRLDVPAAARRESARRRSTTSSRCVTRSGRPRGRARCTARKYRNAAATCDVVFVNSAFTRPRRDRDARRPAERIRVARPAPKAVFRADGPRRGSRRTVRPHGRDARAAQEPPDARRGASSARRRAPPRGRREPRAGESSRCSTTRESVGSATSPTRSSPRLYRGAAVAVYPSRFEGFGIPVDRGDGLRRPRRRLLPRVAGRGERARGRSRRSRRSRTRSPPRSSARSPSASSWLPPGSSTRAGSPGARSARRSCADTRRLLV